VTLLGLVEIIDLIKGVLQFPAAILEFVKLLRKTPEEKHEDLLKKIAEESEKFSDIGRPTW